MHDAEPVSAIEVNRRIHRTRISRRPQTRRQVARRERAKQVGLAHPAQVDLVGTRDDLRCIVRWDSIAQPPCRDDITVSSWSRASQATRRFCFRRWDTIGLRGQRLIGKRLADSRAARDLGNATVAMIFADPRREAVLDRITTT